MQIIIPRNLQANIQQVRPVPNKYNINNIETMTSYLSSKDQHLENEMTAFLIANLEQVSKSQTECWCKKLWNSAKNKQRHVGIETA